MMMIASERCLATLSSSSLFNLASRSTSSMRALSRASSLAFSFLLSYTSRLARTFARNFRMNTWIRIAYTVTRTAFCRSNTNLLAFVFRNTFVVPTWHSCVSSNPSDTICWTMSMQHARSVCPFCLFRDNPSTNI